MSGIDDALGYSVYCDAMVRLWYDVSFVWCQPLLTDWGLVSVVSSSGWC